MSVTTPRSGSPCPAVRGHEDPSPARWARPPTLGAQDRCPGARRCPGCGLDRLRSRRGRPPLSEPALGAALTRRAADITTAFDRIEPVLRRLAPLQFDDGFAVRAQQEIAGFLGVTVPIERLEATWSSPLDLGLVHARCVLGTFCNLAEDEVDRSHARMEEGEDAEELIQRFGFHAVDITACADGRLGGLVDYILRVPPAVVVSRDSYAGSMFDVEAAVHQWEAVELRRWREGVPNAASAPTRYLKIGVYHVSSVDPQHEGCAAHGSDDTRAATELLGLLQDFRAAVERTHGGGAAVAVLLVGVDTDTDAIRVHVPDAAGRTDLHRFVSSADLYDQTAGMAREAAKAHIRTVVAGAMGVDADDEATEGIRWLCGYLLKNNIGQVEAVRSRGGTYADAGHGERLVVAGDAIDDVQLRNLAFQAQMTTLEEGADDLDVGMRILRRSHAPRGLAVPVLVHVAYDDRIPGARARAEARTRRLVRAVEDRYRTDECTGGPAVQGVVRALTGSRLEPVDPDPIAKEADR
ncbi:carboxysome shell carbonic anhydrase [Nocardioides sp.]|uniref:carboxysome shell carbonic anhydrase n=1 Tax=Nocardioides sp. TaxID=35761 RepID=UPI0035280A80